MAAATARRSRDTAAGARCRPRRGRSCRPPQARDEEAVRPVAVGEQLEEARVAPMDVRRVVAAQIVGCELRMAVEEGEHSLFILAWRDRAGGIDQRPGGADLRGGGLEQRLLLGYKPLDRSRVLAPAHVRARLQRTEVAARRIEQ